MGGRSRVGVARLWPYSQAFAYWRQDGLNMMAYQVSRAGRKRTGTVRLIFQRNTATFIVLSRNYVCLHITSYCIFLPQEKIGRFDAMFQGFRWSASSGQRNGGRTDGSIFSRI